MSKYKFHLINSNAKIIRRVKNDLWGTILLTKKNKYKRIFTKLYDKRRKRSRKSFRLLKLMKTKKLVFLKNKIFYLNKYHLFYRKKKKLFLTFYFNLFKKLFLNSKFIKKDNFFLLLKIFRSYFKINLLKFIKSKKKFSKKKVANLIFLKKKKP